ncbi:MAG TPA: hypothetical protein VFW13_00115, partial [Phenylobacterium sp.]|nr:hypothetical protein [Phenylobacterium sp.]
MDIHKPRPVRHWRELVGEVGIIVLGVLIALAAEQAVATLEWRHKAEVAQRAMRLELAEDDGPQLVFWLGTDHCRRDAATAVRAAVERGAGRDEVLKLAERVWSPAWTWDELALRAAEASDVASHMPDGMMDGWFRAYVDMPDLDRQNDRIANDAVELSAVSRTGGTLTPAERDRLIHATEAFLEDDLRMVGMLRFE